MKKTVTAIICTMILALSLAACGAADSGSDENVQIPAPWTDYDGVEEAEAGTGLDIIAPERVGDYEFDFVRVFDDGMLELFYTGADGSSVSIRKAEGSGDISGDYSEYAEIGTLDAAGTQVTVKGDGSGISLALWSADGYTYAIGAHDGGLTEAEVIEAVSAMSAEAA